MKTFFLIAAAFLLYFDGIAQQAQVVIFKHELRWTDESKFPNYFLVPEVHDSIFTDTRLELMKYLKVPAIKMPDEVEYKIINGFGKQKVELPRDISGNEPVIGIFSFITRATAGNAIFWNLNLIIKQNNKIVLVKEVTHELEYFNVSGYVTRQQWISPKEFQEVFKRLIKEALGIQPSSNEKIILGSLEAEEEKARSLFSHPERSLLRINGAWKSAGNFSAIVGSANDTILNFYFRDGWTWELPKPSLSGLLSSLFTDITGIDVMYEQKVSNQKKGTLFFSDGQKFGIRLKWIEIQTRSVMSNDVSTRISAPLTAELFDDKVQVGYFLYTRRQEIHATGKTKEKFNAFTGLQQENTLGIEVIHKIEGSMSDNPVSSEYNESRGIMTVKSGEDLLGVLVVQNCNPENRSIGNVSISKNKVFTSSSGQGITKPSLENEKSVEWFPLYFPEGSSVDSRKKCIETLLCLFFGIGNM